MIALTMRWFSLRRLVLAAPFAALLLLGACATSAGGDEPFNRMAIVDTPFYDKGPDQNLPPARTLYVGERMRIEGMTGEYYHVRLVSGETGWVLARDVGAQREAPQWSGSGR